MTWRTAAILLNAVGAGLLVFRAPEQAALAPGLLAGLLGLAAIWLVSGRTRVVLGVLASMAWLAALGFAAGESVVGVLACAAGLLGAVLTVTRGSAWPGWSSRYARAADSDIGEEASPRQMWESLDRGLDPTRGSDTSSDD